MNKNNIIMKDLKHLKTFENFRVDEEISLPFMGSKKKDLLKGLKEETEFLASNPLADEVKDLYKKYKSDKDRNALRKANSILTKFAESELGKTKKAATDFMRNVYRIIEDRVEELGAEVMKGGRGGSSAST